jgi:hypothetical protein
MVFFVALGAAPTKSASVPWRGERVFDSVAEEEEEGKKGRQGRKVGVAARKSTALLMPSPFLFFFLSLSPYTYYLTARATTSSCWPPGPPS